MVSRSTSPHKSKEFHLATPLILYRSHPPLFYIFIFPHSSYNKLIIMKKHLFRLTTLAVLSVIALSLHARQLSPSEALDRISDFQGMKKAAAAVSPTPVFTAKSAATPNINYFYIFDIAGNRGYMILPADDRLPSMLGFTEKGAFDSNDIPPAFEWLLCEYQREIEFLYQNEDIAENYIYEESSRETIAPLISLQWNQDLPYNLLCPKYSGKLSVTGCVATAMAMVAKYHNYPQKGIGSHSYTHNRQKVSFDYETTEFKWDLMLDEYEDDSLPSPTEEEKNAVAELMLACGVGVNMMYSPSSSGAYSEYIPKALVNFLGYDYNLKYVDRNDYTMTEWEELIYNELLLERPVLLSGVGTAGGHQFVCDGCKNSNLFHINWGWGGISNGYFRLNALNPPALGIGGGGGGFNYYQDAIIGIRPPVEGSVYVPNLAARAMFGARQNGEQTICSFGIGNGVFNRAFREVSAHLGVKITNAAGDIYYVASEDETIFPPFPDSRNPKTVDSFSVPIAGLELPAGKYKVYPAVECYGNWSEYPLPASDTHFLRLTVESNGALSFASGAIAEDASLEVTGMHVRGEILSGEESEIYATVTNEGKERYFDYITADVYDAGGTEKVMSFKKLQGIDSGKTVDVDFEQTFNLEEGLYYIAFTDAAGLSISPRFNILVGHRAESLEISPTVLDLMVGDSRQLNLKWLPENAFKAATWESSDPSVAGVDPVSGFVTAIEEGTAVIRALTSYDAEVFAECSVSVAPLSGVDLITDAGYPPEVFNLAGVKVGSSSESLDRLPPGVYILRSAKGVRVVRK